MLETHGHARLVWALVPGKRVLALVWEEISGVPQECMSILVTPHHQPHFR